MGSSGAGKTTLMDVIAMRKTSGNIEGRIELNGFEQERISFLRSSGYVEQFDVQQPELTVRETVAFSARLRLDVNNPAIGNDATKMKYVDHVLEIMELTDIQTLLVGSFEEGGLSFEQRKRLAIACELAGSPSILFLDEPTSGLDARGALIVIRAMRRIADSGRTVVATIHQPSAAVFEQFDDLILLKTGGNVVFFGELGHESNKLVTYFEERGAKPIERQENPAAWVLRAFAGEQTSYKDWAELYKSSEQFSTVKKQIAAIRDSSDAKKKVTFSSTFSTPQFERIRLMCGRMSTIYRRSAPYNMTRIVVSILYAFLLGSILIASELKEDNLLWGEDEAAALICTIFLSLNVVGTTGEQNKDTSQINFLTPLFTCHDIIFCDSNDDGHPSCEASA
jgi:ABC-type multidrug transport system ATPase subunit